MTKKLGQFSVWIEAESWEPGSWVPNDANSDVVVTWEDGRRWVATFFSYNHIQTLVAKNRATGECLAGTYFWASDMILVDEISRQRIEEVIHDLIASDEFEQVFRAI